ncbi:MAG: STAS-like domain-containing protein [Betaproteobacteria bacterium]
MSGAKTVLVKAALGGEGFPVARSQAKRLLSGHESCDGLELDFSGISEIGQGFADEAFRVWRNAHPAVDLRVVDAGDGVERMLRYVGFRRASN